MVVGGGGAQILAPDFHGEGIPVVALFVVAVLVVMVVGGRGGEQKK